MTHRLVELEQKAYALKNAGKNTEAAELFSAIVKERPDWEHGTALHLLAQCYEDIGQLELAEENYRAALKRKPANNIFLGGFASFLYLHGKPEDAFGAYLDLLAVETNDRGQLSPRVKYPWKAHYGCWVASKKMRARVRLLSQKAAA